VKTDWIIRRGGTELLLFFSGWGMDRRLADHLASSLPRNPAPDLLACHDYRTPDIDAGTLGAVRSYERLTIVAWSFGVWSALHADLPPVAHAVALNGTRSPVDRAAGIAPEVFQATLENYSDESRRRFNRRMCGGTPALTHFLSVEPLRTTACQKEELAAFGGRISASCSLERFRYDHVIIGGKDLVFSPACQFAAWKGYRQTVIADMPHYPFFHLSGLQEVLECSRA